MSATPRRRADDWRTTSRTELNRRWFYDVATVLGYDPRQVIAVRMNQHEAVVTLEDPQGIRSIRHRLVAGDPT